MNNRPIPLSREVIDQDLQIMRATLSVLLQDIRHISAQAADSVQNAVVQLDQARREFARRAIKSCPAPLFRIAEQPPNRKLPTHYGTSVAPR